MFYQKGYFFATGFHDFWHFGNPRSSPRTIYRRKVFFCSPVWQEVKRSWWDAVQCFSLKIQVESIFLHNMGNVHKIFPMFCKRLTNCWVFNSNFSDNFNFKSNTYSWMNFQFFTSTKHSFQPNHLHWFHQLSSSPSAAIFARLENEQHAMPYLYLVRRHFSFFFICNTR